jgi:hypothetical protein
MNYNNTELQESLIVFIGMLIQYDRFFILLFSCFLCCPYFVIYIFIEHDKKNLAILMT